jgi:proteasome lid subunit RPN8/RPN11
MKKISTIEFIIEDYAFDKIKEALILYKNNEIGGMLIGIKYGKNQFIIKDVTIADDTEKLSVSKFIREPVKSINILKKLYKSKNYNYIGEWHSHPQFALYPSAADVNTMKGILSDTQYGVNFVLLIIAKMERSDMSIAGFLFHPKISRFARADITRSKNIMTNSEIKSTKIDFHA